MVCLVSSECNDNTAGVCCVVRERRGGGGVCAVW